MVVDDAFESYFFIVNYHALTTLHDAEALRKYSFDVALDYLALIVWLQLLRTAAQGLIFVVGLALPALAMLLTLVATAWAFWILLHFVAEAMALSGLGQSAVVLLIAVFGMFIGVGILLALMAMLAQGVLGNV